MLALSVATSIDALAVGFSLAMVRIDVWQPAVVIGVVTAAMSIAGVKRTVACHAPLFVIADLDLIAAGDRDVAALHGWRREAFGDDAIRLCKGEIALSAKGSEVRVVRL